MQTPWISPLAVDFIKPILTKKTNVFEYGSGSSTIFWAAHCNRVVSVEHDPIWYRKTQENGKDFTNLQLILEEPELGTCESPANPDAYTSDDARYSNRIFRRYASTIDLFPSLFDLILIDGRARPSCLKHALPKIAIKGFLIWDDMSRDYYYPAADLIPATWICHKFSDTNDTWIWERTI
jgi:predicted O-methyltransferase YrrM